MTCVNMKNISKTIKGKTVLSNINLQMESGKIYGFHGINGSGKTMLMRVVSGLIRPTEGVVFINGKQLHKDISFPESIGVFLENPAFLDYYSGLENLKILASIKKIATEEQINGVLDFVGLGGAKNKKYRKYSLGMKQRLGIAAAVMEEPEILILDEPTNSLDSDGVKMIEDLIKKEKERGALVIFSCHDNELLKALSDEIIFIESGRITSHSVKGERVNER